MARLSKPDLLHTITSAIAECGWHVLYMDDQHPFRLQVYSGDASIPVRIYIWNITHGGGRARPAHECRIQITGVSRFEPEPNGKTLILGWWDEAGVFAGFDFNKHRGMLGASPSLQIHKECLQLVTFDKTYVVEVNEEEMRRLADADRIGGLDKFRKGLRPLILLPPAIADRPHVEFVTSANQIRGWRL